jgi:hypothetical protein
MGRGSYLGGHTVTNGRQSAREEWNGPKYQSALSARLLGDPDPLVVELGERLLELERDLSFALGDIKTKTDSDFPRLALETYIRARPTADREAILRTFTDASRQDVEKQQAKVANLSEEIARITSWTADLEGHWREIADYLRPFRKRKG